MEKNYSISQKNRVNIKHLLITVLLTVGAFFTTNSAFSQTCSVNAGDQLLHYCVNGPVTIGVGGSAPASTASTLWTQLSGPSVVIDNPNSITTTLAGAVSGTYKFRLSGTCVDTTPSATQDITVVVFDITTANAGPDIEGCPGTYSLSANTLAAGETGMWQFVSGNASAASITNTTSPTSSVVFSPTSSGTATYQWIITNNNSNAPASGTTTCTSFDTVTFTNYGGEVPVTVSAFNPSECYTSTTSTTLIGSQGGIGLGDQSSLWTFVSTTASSVPSGLPSTDNEPTVSGLSEGSYTFRYTVTGPCATGTETVTINVPPATQNISGASAESENFCTGVTSTILKGSLPLYTGETVEWIQTAGPATPESLAAGGNGNVFATTPETPITLNGSSGYNFTYQIKGGPANPTCESNLATARIRYYNDLTTINLNSGNNTVTLPEDVTSGSVPIIRTGGNDYDVELISGPLAASAINFNANRNTNVFSFSDLEAAGTYVFEVKNNTDGLGLTGCTDSSAFLNVIVSRSTNTPNPGTGLNFACGLTSGSLTGNTPGLGTAYWTQIGGPLTVTITPTNPSGTDIDISGLNIEGVYTFRYTFTGSGPTNPSQFADQTVTITTAPTVTPGTSYLRGSGNALCPDSFITDQAPLGLGQTGLWTVAQADDNLTGDPLVAPNLPVIDDPTNPITEISNLQVDANYQFTWTVSSTSPTVSCPSAFDTITVETNDQTPPSFAEAGADQCVASGANTILDATPLVVGTGTWTYVSGPADPFTVANQNDPAANLGVLAAGNYEFLWTTANGACQEYTDTVVVTVLDGPSVANAGVDQLGLCITDESSLEVTMSGASSSPAIAVGTWSFVNGVGGWTVSDINDPNAKFSNLVEGVVYEFRWTVTQGNCDTATDTVSFSVYYNPPVAAAGPDTSVCYEKDTGSGSPTVVNLAATPISGTSSSTGNWTFISGPGSSAPSITSPSSPNSAITGLVSGDYTFRWTVSNSGPCPPSSDEVVITVTETADAGPDQALCNASFTVLTGNEGTEGTWTQVANGAPAVTISNSAFNTATVAFPTVTVAQEIFEFEYEITNPAPPFTAPCVPTDTMTVTISGLPTTPDAGPNQVLCAVDAGTPRTTSVTMAANTITLGTGSWTLDTKPSGAPDPGNLSSTSPTAIFTNLEAGLYVFEWVAANGECDDLRSVVRVNVFDPPSTANIITPDGSAQCQLFTELEATAPTSGIGSWSFVSYVGSGTYNPGDLIIDNPNNTTTSLTAINPNTLPLGDYTFAWTVSSVGSGTTFSPNGNGATCGPSQAQVTIAFDGLPPAQPNAGTDQTICNLDPLTPTNASLIAVGINATESGQWTVSMQPGGSPTVSITTPNSESTSVSNLVDGEYEFLWSVTNAGGGCVLTDTVKVTVVDAVANANAGPDQDISQFDSLNLAANDPIPGNGVWSLVSGPNTPNILDVSDPNTLITGTVPGSYEFTWTIPNSPCVTTADNVVINISPSIDLSLNKTLLSPMPANVDVGDTLDFQITITNDNATFDGTGVDIQDSLPIGYTLVGGTVSNGGIFNFGGNEINWTNLTVPAGSTLNLTYSATVNAATGAPNEYTNTAEVVGFDQSDPDSTPDNQVLSEDDMVALTLAPGDIVDLELNKTIDNATPNVGSNVVFTITVNNNGPSDATGVEVTDIIPTGYTYVSSNASTGTINSLDPSGTGVVWSVGNVSTSQNEILEITVSVNASGNYTNTAEITDADQTDSNSTPDNDVVAENDQDTSTSTPVPVVDLSLSKAISAPANGSSYLVGETVTFTITVNNVGPSTATGINVVEYLPTGYTWVSDDGGTTYDYTTGSWDVGTLTSTSSKSLEIKAIINDSGDYNNVAEIVYADQKDPNSIPGNNTLSEDDQAQVEITPIKVADLSLVKTVDEAAPRVGDNVKFTLALTNAGPSDATSVVVNDQLPVGYTFVSFTSTSGSYDSVSGDWTLSGSVLDGKTEYLDIVATVNAAIENAINQYKNDAQVTASDQLDPDSTVNDGTGDDSSTVSTVPTALIDLSLTKSVDNVQAIAGTDVVFTVVVSNDGPSKATGVVVTDQLPSGYTLVSHTGGTSYVPATGVWTIGNIANGTTATLNVTATVNATGDYTNVAEITSATETDLDSSINNDDLTEDDQDQVTVSRDPLVNLSLTKGVDVASPNVGDNVDFTITVTNAGPSDATGVVVTDKLPSGYSFVSSTPSGSTSYNEVSGSWTIGNLGITTATLTVTAKVLPTGNYNNVAEVTGTNEVDGNSTPGNNDILEDDQEEVVVTPVQSADLSVAKVVDVQSPNVGDNVTFTIDVSNAGPSDATNVIITDQLPSGYQFVSASPTAGMYNNTTGLWTVSRPILAGTTETIQIVATVLESGNYINNAEVTSSDQADPDSTVNDGAGDDFSTVTPTPIALVDLALIKRIDNATPDVGSDVVFTIEIVNNGPSNATGVVSTDLLPTGYSWVSDDSATYVPSTGVWTIGNLTIGTTATLNITATVLATGDYTNTATVTSTEADSNSSNNTNTVSSIPRAVADLVVTKAVINASPNVGEDVVFNLTVKNEGPSDATGVVVTDQLPSGYAFVSSMPSGTTTYNDVSGAWNVGSLANGVTATLSITAKVLGTGDYDNVAQVTGSDQYDLNSTPNNNNPTENDYSEVLVNPINSSNLVTTKVVDDPNPNEGDTIVYTISVTNNGGTTAATGVSLTDNLPVGVTYVSDDSSGAYNSGSGIWTIGDLAVNATVVLKITATVDVGTSGDTINNTTTAAAGDQTDPDTVGDDLTEAIIVNLFPIAVNDESLLNAVGAVTIADITAMNPTTADSDPDGTIDVTTINLVAPTGATAIIVTSGDTVGFTVPGEGTWSITESGAVTFTPVSGFTSNPTPINYTIEDNDGNISNEAIITITYVVIPPTAEDDVSDNGGLGHAPGAVSLDPLVNNGSGVIAMLESLVEPPRRSHRAARRSAACRSCRAAAQSWPYPSRA